MDINAALRAFVRTVEKGSITAAARDLSISQPAVTKHLRNLERHVNARLLERTNRMVRPTGPGLTLYESSKTALAEIEAALEGVRRDMGVIDGQLRIFGPSCLGTEHLHSLVGEFQSNYPAVSVDLVLDNRHVDVVYENFDLAFRYGTIENQELVVRRIGMIKRLLVAAPAYLERIGIINCPLRLAEVPIVTTLAVLSPQGTLTLYRQDDSIEIPVRSSLRTNNAQVIVRAPREGRGIGPVQEILVADDLERGDLVQVLPEYNLKPTELFLVYPSARFMRPVVRAFIDFVAARLRTVQGIE